MDFPLLKIINYNAKCRNLEENLNTAAINKEFSDDQMKILFEEIVNLNNSPTRLEDLEKLSNNL